MWLVYRSYGVKQEKDTRGVKAKQEVREFVRKFLGSNCVR